MITAAYNGIGVETVKALLSLGAKALIVGGRNSKLQEKFVSSLADDRVDGSRTIDLGDLTSVKAFIKYVNDKGVNVIGHFLLAKLRVEKTKRQVWVASIGHNLFGDKRVAIGHYKSFSLETSPCS
jgi:NAD(P)-dependent dehydrogenase (short-subunit alcohol dehydrogenase family)